MTSTTTAWEQRIAALWSAFDDLRPDDFRAEMQALADELPSGHEVAIFEMASVNDSIDEPELAVSLYRQALAAGLGGRRRRSAVIQLASTLRSLGQTDESIALLKVERNQDPELLDEETAELGDAVDAFLALALIDVGRDREAAILALQALSRRIPHYSRSLANYATALGE